MVPDKNGLLFWPSIGRWFRTTSFRRNPDIAYELSIPRSRKILCSRQLSSLIQSVKNMASICHWEVSQRRNLSRSKVIANWRFAGIISFNDLAFLLQKALLPSSEERRRNPKWSAFPGGVAPASLTLINSKEGSRVEWRGRQGGWRKHPQRWEPSQCVSTFDKFS